MTSPTKLALIGAGGIAGVHISGILTHPHFVTCPELGWGKAKISGSNSPGPHLGTAILQLSNRSRSS